MELDKKFINRIRAGERVFGNPVQRITQEIKDTDEALAKYKSGFGAGDFFVSNKDLEGQLKGLKAKKEIITKSSDYILRIINKCYDEPYRNMIIFSDVYLGDQYFNIVISTKFSTFAINFTDDSSKEPVYISEGVVCSASGSVVHELSSLDEEVSEQYGIKVLDISYNKSPMVILKNDEYYSSSALFMNISDLKDYLDKDKENPELGKTRYEILQFLFENIYKKEESQFLKEAKKAIGFD